MPLYEYLCHSCGQTIEVIQKFSDAPLTVHDVCGGELEKLISRSAIQFKGSGWYVTDYGKGGVVPKNNEGASGDSKAADSKGGSSNASGDSKSSDSKSSDSKSSESKSSESKSGDSKAPAKSSDSKSSDAKTPAKPSPAPATTT